MFLRLFSMRYAVYTSNAVRNSSKFFNKLGYRFEHKRLSLHKKWKAGRGANGNIILYSRSSLLKKQKHYKINYNFRYNDLAVIASFQFIPFKNKLLSLLFFKNGEASYVLTTDRHKLFSYILFNTKKRFKKLKFKSIFFMLFQIKKLSLVCLLELYPGAPVRYCRSSGSRGKIIKFDSENHTVLIRLPSGFKKIFSFYSFAFLGKVALSLHSKITSTKSGYWRTFGIKPSVRGVAMNPVDHPHGGRTKAIKYPRTPWGKTAKFK
jgi:large subunit ribosomal protein L2